MAQQQVADPKIKSLDPVWSRIRSEAEEMLRADPSLGGFIYSSILNHNTFEEAVSHRIAQRLHHTDVPGELIVQAFEDALSADLSIGSAIRADIIAIEDRDPACHRYIDPVLYYKGFQAVQAYRMAHQLWNMGRKDFALYVQSRSSLTFSIDIHPAAKIGRGLMIDHAHSIVIGETAVVGNEVSMLHSVTLGGTGKDDGDRHPKIGSGVLIGAGASVLGNISVGACSRIAAGSVVLKDIPPNRTVAGVPARIVGYAGCSEPARSMDHILPQEEDVSAEVDK